MANRFVRRTTCSELVRYKLGDANVNRQTATNKFAIRT